MKAPFAYVVNSNSQDVSVIDTATNQVVAKSATLSTLSPDVYDVIDADGLVISPPHRLLWHTVDLDAGVRDHEDRTPKYGYTTTREAAMAALAKSWRRKVE
jgi:YVTN family beta-propeller protein